MNDIAVIALDMDGTLLTSDHQILSETINSLQVARKKGLKVILVTGRHHMLAYPSHAFLDLDTPIICSNGAYLFDPFEKKIIDGAPLLVEQWKGALSFVEKFDLDVICHLEDGLAHNPANRHILKISNYTQTFAPHLRPTYLSASDLISFCENHAPVWKMEFSHSDPNVIEEFTALLSARYNVTCDRTSPTDIEVVNQANSKGNCLAAWTNGQGYSMQQVMAFGDNRNDISMFQQVGLGIAMGNALPDVQHHAHHVTATNDNNGIAVALQRWVL